MLSLDVPGMWHCDDEEVTILDVLPSLAFVLMRFLTVAVLMKVPALSCVHFGILDGAVCPRPANV